MRLFGEIFNHYNILNFIVDFKIPGLSSSAFWVIFITETIFWKIWLALIYRDEVEKDDCWQMTPYLHSLLPIRRLSLFISNIFSHIWTRHDWHASCQKCRWGGSIRHVMNTWKTHRIFEVWGKIDFTSTTKPYFSSSHKTKNRKIMPFSKMKLFRLFLRIWEKTEKLDL